MGDKFWHKKCNESSAKYVAESGECGTVYSGGPAIYEMQLGKGITLEARVRENALRVFGINASEHHVDVVFLSKNAVVRPASAIEEAKKYTGEIELLGKEHSIGVENCIKLLQNGNANEPQINLQPVR